jgi:hypothetical protein
LSRFKLSLTFSSPPGERDRVNGRKLFPETIGTIAPNQPANLVLFRFDGEMGIERTILTGKEVWRVSDYK